MQQIKEDYKKTNFKLKPKRREDQREGSQSDYKIIFINNKIVGLFMLGFLYVISKCEKESTVTAAVAHLLFADT